MKLALMLAACERHEPACSRYTLRHDAQCAMAFDTCEDFQRCSEQQR